MPTTSLCRCGCGTPTKGTWARGHARRGPAAERIIQPIPGPGDIDSAIIDVGELIPDEVSHSASPPDGAAPHGLTQPAGESPRRPAAGSGPHPGPEPDTGPAHGQRGWARAPRQRKGTPKLTSGIRADIHAKISLPLEVLGRIWQARDPLCGGVFVTQRPDIADALANIVCESADLVAFFTSSAGGFMKYLELGAALWPVSEVVMAHHVMRSIETQPDAGQQPDLAQYAA